MLAALFVMGLGLVAAAATPAPATAAAADCPSDRFVPVVQVSGRLDPVLVDYVTSELDSAQDDCAPWVVLHVNSNGAAGNEDGAIPLSIGSSLTDTDSSESLSITISGVPSGANKAYQL